MVVASVGGAGANATVYSSVAAAMAMCFAAAVGVVTMAAAAGMASVSMVATDVAAASAAARIGIADILDVVRQLAVVDAHRDCEFRMSWRCVADLHTFLCIVV